MNKILNINLGGYALTIDDDAYEYLSAYLDNIRKRFSESEGRDEIIHDIEMRMGELISAGLGTRTIVMLPEVEAAIQIMGKPEDFGGEPAEPVKNAKSNRSSRQQSIKTGKRLFRDEEDVVVAGICSGLSAYFGITDPVWMRLIFVLLTFLSAGFWVPAYLLLWILVPQAKTAADRLAMRGEPVNVDNIAREIEEGFERLSHKVNEFGADAKKNGMNAGQNAFSAGVSAIGQVFGTSLRLFAKFWALIAIVVGLCLFLALAIGWMAGIWGIFAAAPYVEYFSPYSNAATWLGFTNAFFLLSIPVLGLCLMFARVLFKVRTPTWLGTSLTLFWVLNVVCGFLFAVFVVKEFRQGGVVKTPIDLSSVRSDTLRIETDNFIT
ncbi:MAG: PspC domain-containing protein, partial [Bacteroidota bacterium]